AVAVSVAGSLLRAGEPANGRREPAVLVVNVVGRQAELPEIVGAARPGCRLADAHNRRQEQRPQGGEDAEAHPQADQGEAAHPHGREGGHGYPSLCWTRRAYHRGVRRRPRDPGGFAYGTGVPSQTRTPPRTSAAASRQPSRLKAMPVTLAS